MFEQLPGNKVPTFYAKFATVLAVTAGICFGLCSLGAVLSINSDTASKFLAIPASVCGGIVLVCLVGLLMVGVIVVISSIINLFRRTDKN